MSEQNKNTLLIHIDDYAQSGLEFAEITMRLHSFLDYPERVRIDDVSTPSLDTVAQGFVVAQLALAPTEGRKVIYANCAPRRTSDKARRENQDHGIKYVKLKNGVEIVAVWSESAFSFLRSEIEVFRNINCPSKGSQFRSRDFFPKVVAEVVNGNYSSLTEDLSIESIPLPAHDEVAWTDGFGNIKTTMRMSDLKTLGLEPGQKVLVSLNGVSMLGVVSVGGFQVDRGVLAINAGSSGYDDPFIELFLRVHHMSEQTAAVRFGYPVGGTKFELRPI